MNAKPTQRYALCLICIDGRIQQVVRDWVLDTYAVEYLDIISEPGMDAFMARSGPVDRLLSHVDVSTKRHGSQIAFIVGHDSCSGNDVPADQHKRDLYDALERLQLFRPQLHLVALWVSRQNQVVALKELKPR